MMFQASKPGILPTDTQPTVAGVRLPQGRLVQPDPGFASGEANASPVLWIADTDLDDASTLAELAAHFATTGLWPLALSSLDGDGARPWLDGELDPSASSLADHDAGRLLADFWAGGVPIEEEGDEAVGPLAPFGRTFPGLALPGPANEEDVSLSDMEPVGRLGLVAVTRPADAVVALGWTGPVNHFSDMGQLAAVLRSWEDRFGACVVGVGFDTLTLLVERPPMDLDHALAVSAEHCAICPDNIHQGAGSIEEYASEIVGQRIWSFWWD